MISIHVYREIHKKPQNSAWFCAYSGEGKGWSLSVRVQDSPKFAAAAIARRMSSVGRLQVSLRRSIMTAPLSHSILPQSPAHPKTLTGQSHVYRSPEGERESLNDCFEHRSLSTKQFVSHDHAT